ncbi:hypothetical protein JCM19231_1691 [Vibrio ishigakensis]|nr:hypothetical protein JCM19231_1691 [Vibrio ishigakensis]
MGFVVAHMPGDQSWPMLTMMGVCSFAAFLMFKLFGDVK